jgi:hypothetical protein
MKTKTLRHTPAKRHSVVEEGPFFEILLSYLVILEKKLPPYNLAGFDLTTDNSAGGDDTTRPRYQLCPELFGVLLYFGSNG